MLPIQVVGLPDWLPYREVIEGLPDIAVQLGMFALVAVAVSVAGGFVVAPLARYVTGALGAHDRLQQFLANATKLSAVPAAVLAGLLVAGFELASVTVGVVLLVGLLGVALAADDLVRDLVGGIFLLVSQPFAHGDWIRFGDVEGRVEHIGVRMTEIRTFDNETTTVPNAVLNEVPVTNRSAQSKLRQRYHFGIAYDEDTADAMEAVLMAAREVDGVVEEPVPDVRAVGFEPSWVTLRTTVWLENPTRLEYIDVRSQFIRAAKAALTENGIDINPEKTELSGRLGTVELDGDGTAVERNQGGR